MTHSDQLPVPIPTRCQDPVSVDESTTDEDDITIDDYVLNSNLEEKKSYYPNQKDLNDLIRDLGLTKSNAELLTSRVKQWTLCDDSVQITKRRKRHQSFSSFFTMQNASCFCNKINGLFYSIGIPCIPSKWRRFIDSLSTSLKAVLLHNGNQYPPLPLVHSIHLKETYENVKTVLNVLKYEQYNWEVIGDFKIIPFRWECRVGSRNIPATFVFGIAEKPNPTIKSKYGQNVRNLLLERKMSKDGAASKYLLNLFPKLSEAKVKDGIFIGPQVKLILKSDEFLETLSAVEKDA